MVHEPLRSNIAEPAHQPEVMASGVDTSASVAGGGNSKKCDITPPQDWKISDITHHRPPIELEKARHHPLPHLENNRHDPGQDSKYCDSLKYLKTDSIQNGLVPVVVDPRILQLLSDTGLSGAGLSKLCCQPELDWKMVRAVVLYAQAHKLGPGYIYQSLIIAAPIEPLFLDLAGLADETISLFRQTAQVLQHGVIPAQLAVIRPDDWPVFSAYAETVYGVDASLLATLSRRQQSEVATPPHEEDELATLWQEVLESLRYQTVQSAFDAWLKPSRLIAIKGNQVTIAVHNEAARQWLTHRLFIVIQRVMKQCLGWAVILNFVIAAESSETRQSSELLQLAG
jgi:hypothetical protein